ncbi:hypothetical protein [uncultured Gammaproteobacteria bacterium]|nr:hypothetical protein [uncultured Gammaproteobacteria bacterium]
MQKLNNKPLIFPGIQIVLFFRLYLENNLPFADAFGSFLSFN